MERHNGGSNTLPNIAGLCSCCHGKVHTDPKVKKQLNTLKSGMNKKYGALSVLNQVIPALVSELGALFPARTYVTNGRSTHTFREARGVAKDHYLDAYCIACSVLSTVAVVDDGVEPFQVLQYRRRDRQACHKAMMNRKYCAGKDIVATNRHKAYEQNEPSLEEYRASHSEAAVSKLIATPHPAQYKNMERIMPGSIVDFDGKVAVFNSSTGTENGRPSYYIPVGGNKVRANKCKFVANNTGITFA